MCSGIRRSYRMSAMQRKVRRYPVSVMELASLERDFGGLTVLFRGNFILTFPSHAGKPF